MYTPTYDVFQIVDRYAAHYAARKSRATIDPQVEAQTLSMLARPLGRNSRRIAILAQSDKQRLEAYQRAGYETIAMNGDRSTELRRFVLQMGAQIQQLRPHHTVVVSDDPEFVHLCSSTASLTQISIWADSATVPRDLAAYNWQPLEEMLPMTRVARLDVRVDLENLIIGAAKRGWEVDMRGLIEAIRAELADAGELVRITGYGDFDDLNRNYGRPGMSLMRDWALAGGDLRFVASQHGKNTADMRMADDVRTEAEQEAGAAGVDVIVLVTMDRDFRHVVDTVRQRGKKALVMGLKGGLSRELESVAHEVRYLDNHLRLGRPAPRLSAAPAGNYARMLLKILARMGQNRWSFVYRDQLEQQFKDEPEATALIDQLVVGELLVPATGQNDQGRPGALSPSPTHATVRGARILIRWIPERVAYCLNQKGMPYVDTNFLANGMARDSKLAELRVGQSRAEAELWLRAAAEAGLVHHRVHPHPSGNGRQITTWWLDEEGAEPRDGAQDDEGGAAREPGQAPLAADRRLRAALTERLSESELTTLLFDWFLPVYREVEGATKGARIHALLDYVERRGCQEQLIAALVAVNPALAEGLHG